MLIHLCVAVRAVKFRFLRTFGDWYTVCFSGCRSGMLHDRSIYGRVGPEVETKPGYAAWNIIVGVIV